MGGRKNNLSSNPYYLSSPNTSHGKWGTKAPQRLHTILEPARLSKAGDASACPDSSTHPDTNMYPNARWESQTLFPSFSEVWVLMNQKSASIQLLILLSVSTQCYVAQRAPDTWSRILRQYFYSAHKNRTCKEAMVSSAHLASLSFAIKQDTPIVWFWYGSIC